MSKSYNNTLPLFGDVKKIRKQIMRIVTDSRPMEDPKDPTDDHLFQLYQLFASPAEVDAMAAKYRAGGFGYGEIKKAVAEVSEEHFAPAREKRAELEADLDTVRDILAEGAKRAREVAAGVVERARRNCGLR
jgi:tryptophanyl-tRNA synthetase